MQMPIYGINNLICVGQHPRTRKKGSARLYPSEKQQQQYRRPLLPALGRYSILCLIRSGPGSPPKVHVSIDWDAEWGCRNDRKDCSGLGHTRTNVQMIVATPLLPCPRCHWGSGYNSRLNPPRMRHSLYLSPSPYRNIKPGAWIPSQQRTPRRT